MSEASDVVEKHILITTEQAEQLRRLSEAHHLTEDQLVTKALDILFSVTDLLDDQQEQRGWSVLSEDALHRVWDNDEDAIYDNWKELYGLSAR